MKKTTIIPLAIAALVGSAIAEGLKGDGKFGAAGCGLGSMVVHDQPGAAQIGATLLNGIGSQTFAITTGTSNCFEDGVTLNEMEQEVFASVNYESLNQEISQGRGENLSAFASLFGCRGEAVERFSAAAQSNYSAIFPSGNANSSLMVENIQGMLKSNPQLQASCSEQG